MMAKTTKKKTLPSHLTDFEKLAGVILLLVYLVVLPFFGRAITDAVGTLLGTSISPALSNVICFYLLFAAAVLIFHSFLYQTSQTLFMGIERCLKTLGLGLEDKMEVKVGVLSGGQRQAMALLMSTMTPIEFLILDEHTAALDPKTAETIMELTDKIVREKKLTTIMVTHNLRYAVDYGNRLLMMHQGTIVIDKADEEKDAVQIDEILKKFNEISIECGN